MLVLTILACNASPVRPVWISVCDPAGPHVTCVNADTVTFTNEDDPKVICHWNCAELRDEGDALDSGQGVAAEATGLDLVFQRDADGVCYEMHAHRFEARCDGD